MFNPPNFMRKLASVTAPSELSFHAQGIARWDNEGGAPTASELHKIPHDEEDQHRAPMSDGDGNVFLIRPAAPRSKSRELRALDDLYHQSVWKGQN
jgi:hypothetical protein